MICVCGHKARNCERNGIKIINLLPAIISGLIMSNAMNATQQGIAMQFKNSHLLSRGILILWGREIKWIVNKAGITINWTMTGHHWIGYADLLVNHLQMIFMIIAINNKICISCVGDLVWVKYMVWWVIADGEGWVVNEWVIEWLVESANYTAIQWLGTCPEIFTFGPGISLPLKLMRGEQNISCIILFYWLTMIFPLSSPSGVSCCSLIKSIRLT